MLEMTKIQSQTAFHLAGEGYRSLLEPFGDFKFLHKKSSAFTLAEMMVVMLIMSIILAAMAPIMTTRIKSGRTASSSPWQWANNGVGPNAYFATQALPKAIIGQNDALEEDNGRLIINTQNDYAHLLFKRNGNTLARFSIGNSDQPSFALNTSGSIGNGSVAFGSGALNNNTTGDYNTAIGYQALINEPSHSNNTAIGALTMANNNGSENTAVGSGALQGNNNVANNTGSDNVAVGTNALNANKSGAYNVAIGVGALRANTTGEQNTAIGYWALSANTEGRQNTALGLYALKSLTGKGDEVNDNTAIGYRALEASKSGLNTAVGSHALYQNKSGDRNTAVGINSLNANKEGSNNVAVGMYALLYSNGDGNTAIGTSTLHDNEGGGYNTAIGYGALYKAGGDNNTALGYQACSNVTSGSNITCIGANSGPKDSSSAKSHVVYLGTEEDTVYIPGNLIVYGNVGLATKGHKVVNLRMGCDNGGDYATLESDTSRHVRFSDNNRTGHGNDVSFENALIYSDSRLKYVGSENKSGLDKIRQLKIFNYTFKKDEKKTPHVGVIAQDLQKVFPNAVTKGEDGFLRIRMEDMFYAVVNAVKELDAKINVILSETKDLKKQVTEILRSAQNDKKQAQIDREILKQVQNDNKQLKKENAELKQTLKQVQGDNKELKARLERLEQKLR